MGSEKAETTTGRCLCGDIRFEYQGVPIKSQHCHCESCRRHTSSPISTFVIVDDGSFRFTRGTTVAFISSPGVTRTHCGRCGSPITYESESEPGLVSIYACALDDPTRVTPAFHAFTAEQMPWLEVDDTLPRYEHGSLRGETPVSYGPRRPASSSKAGGNLS